jgi:hypothetical protein
VYSVYSVGDYSAKPSSSFICIIINTSTTKFAVSPYKN